jgi:hypothetical protein
MHVAPARSATLAKTRVRIFAVAAAHFIRAIALRAGETPQQKCFAYGKSVLTKSSRALAEAKRVKTWWRRHWLGNPALIENELEAALGRVLAKPDIGVQYGHASGSAGPSFADAADHEPRLLRRENDTIVVLSCGARQKAKSPSSEGSSELPSLAADPRSAVHFATCWSPTEDRAIGYAEVTDGGNIDAIGEILAA